MTALIFALPVRYKENFMKLIHCADLHLDSKLNTYLDRERAKRRRDELLRNFERLAQYAAENGVEAILIAGDLFDRDTVSALAANMVLSVIRSQPQIRFYYLRGNHDLGDCLGKAAEGEISDLPNLRLFGERWKTYYEGAEGKIAITGIELTNENSAAAQASLRIDPACFNIVMLHGQESGGRTFKESLRQAGGASTALSGSFAQREEKGRGYAGRISLPALRGRGIDYLALGHVHTYKKAPLDSRGIYCYPGCLEGRGFDECGQHGFVELEINEQTGAMSCRFVPFARRTLYALQTDVTGCLTTAQMKDLMEDTLHMAGCRKTDMADLTLCGELDVDCEKDPDYLRMILESEFFFARLHDATTLRINAEDYLYDESLRGEFVRLVMADPSVPAEEKNAVIRCGFQAMDGEDLL